MHIDDPMRVCSARRRFLATGTTSLGALALASLLDPRFAMSAPALPELGTAKARAKKVIYLFQSEIGRAHV